MRALTVLVGGAAALVAPPRAAWRAPFKIRAATAEDGAPLAATLLAADAAAVPGLITAHFDALDAATMTTLAAAAGDAATAAASARVAEAINAETARRAAAARAALERVLDGGDLLAMDRRLATLARDGGVDPPFLACVGANAAAAPAGSDRRRVLEHLHTRAQEELEKRVAPAAAVLNRLARQPDAAIRGNLLREFLAPRTEIYTPNAERIALDAPLPPQVGHADFARALDAAVAALRALDADGDLVRANIEQCRAIAKEARAVLLDAGMAPAVAEFQDALADTWTPSERG